MPPCAHGLGIYVPANAELLLPKDAGEMSETEFGVGSVCLLPVGAPRPLILNTPPLTEPGVEFPPGEPPGDTPSNIKP